MALSKHDILSAALTRDLSRPGAKGASKVVDDSARKVFTVNRDGAIFVFGYNQPDGAYWNGVKHYGSGLSSRIRIRRAKDATAE